ncbi:MAG TPA: hypothetical protein DCS19_09370 [Flavobacterium sp.]|nr:hypothetical protein [Flavobacterium sp.]
MSIQFIVPRKSGRLHLEHLKEKACKFPGCGKIFFGTGRACYCEEHRDSKYRKVIDFDKNKKIKDDFNETNLENNQIIKSKKFDTKRQICKCGLDDCHETFEISITQGEYVYPKFCPDHRNEYKRSLFLKRLQTVC